eukprot:8787889-Pyramimonas_sp.AAC.1
MSRHLQISDVGGDVVKWAQGTGRVGRKSQTVLVLARVESGARCWYFDPTTVLLLRPDPPYVRTADHGVLVLRSEDGDLASTGPPTNVTPTT